MCNGCGAYDETLSQSLRVCRTDQLLLGWDLLKYLTAISDQFLHAYRWARTSWIRFLQMAYRCGRSLKISQTGFPISNNQPLPVPPQCGPGFDFQTKASLRTCWGHSAFSHCWMNTEFPSHRCQRLQTQSEALSRSELLNVDNFAKK